MTKWIKRGAVLGVCALGSLLFLAPASAAPPLADDGSESTPNEDHCCPESTPWMRPDHTCHGSKADCEHHGNQHATCRRLPCHHH